MGSVESATLCDTCLRETSNGACALCAAIPVEFIPVAEDRMIIAKAHGHGFVWITHTLFTGKEPEDRAIRALALMARVLQQSITERRPLDGVVFREVLS